MGKAQGRGVSSTVGCGLRRRARLARCIGSLAALALVVACAADAGMPEGAGGATGAEPTAGAPASAAAAPGQGASTQPMSAGLRAAYVQAVQNDAAPAYDFGPGARPGTAAAENAAQGLRVELADARLRVEAATDDDSWSVGFRWSAVGRGGDLEPVAAASEAELGANRAS